MGEELVLRWLQAGEILAPDTAVVVVVAVAGDHPLGAGLPMMIIVRLADSGEPVCWKLQLSQSCCVPL